MLVKYSALKYPHHANMCKIAGNFRQVAQSRIISGWSVHSAQLSSPFHRLSSFQLKVLRFCLQPDSAVVLMSEMSSFKILSGFIHLSIYHITPHFD